MEGIASIDLFVVPTITFQQLFAFLVLDHERRRLSWFAVTRNPTADLGQCAEISNSRQRPSIWRERPSGRASARV
jgi:hypothetical protein